MLKQLKSSAVALVGFGRSVLSEDGEGSWSRVGSAMVVTTWCAVFAWTRKVPDHSEGAAYMIGALYGMNQIKSLGAAFASVKASLTTPDPTVPDATAPDATKV